MAVNSVNSQVGNVTITPATIGAIPVGALSAYTTTTQLTTLLGGKASTNDPRLTDARTPKPHANSHDTGQSDAIIPANIGAVATNDGRLSDSRTPKAHHASHATGGSDPITPSSIGAVAVSDARLSDARPPEPHATSHNVGGSDALSITGIGGVASGDARLTNARTPTAHGNTHAAGGSDPITPSSIGAATASALNNYQVRSTKGSPNGYASLDGGGLVPTSQLPYPTTVVATVNGKTGPTVNLSAADVGAASNSDARLTNARTPTAHASSHAIDGTDVLTPAAIGALPNNDVSVTNARTPILHAATHHSAGTDPITATSIGALAISLRGANNGLAELGSDGKVPSDQLPTFSTTSGVTSVNGDDGPDVNLTVTNIPGAVNTSDARLTNARTPTAHAASHATGGSDELTVDDIGAVASTLVGANSGLATLDSFGKVPNTQSQVASNDTRLTNARTPTVHASTHATGGSDAITPASIGAATTAAIAGFQATSAKGVANGYASLNGSAIVPSNQLPATMAPTIHAASHATGGSDPITPASIGAATATSLSGLETQSNKGQANGYASLNSSSMVPNNQLPATMTPTAHASTHATGGTDAITPTAIGAATTASLAAYQVTSQKGIANGYPSLDASTKIPVSQLPNNQVIVLSASAPVPSGTPSGTVIMRTAT